jgi:hypothetical protein
VLEELVQPHDGAHIGGEVPAAFRHAQVQARLLAKQTDNEVAHVQERLGRLCLAGAIEELGE